jgi:hypothetical protein
MELSQSTSKVISTATFAPFGHGTGLRIIGLSLWLKNKISFNKWQAHPVAEGQTDPHC